jgi:hypothetical protein
MRIFRIFLATLWLMLAGYTAVVISSHGLGLLPIFFGDMVTMAWPGQFNLDFMFMLLLSALWVSWRHRFSPAGFALALLALFGGAAFLTVYLFVLSLQSKGDVKAMLLGAHAWWVNPADAVPAPPSSNVRHHRRRPA